MERAMFKKMEYIYAVYKEQSFTRAAEKLYISQPCLSAAIKKVEEEIGAPLFERRYSSVRPTKIGYEYIAAVEKIMGIEQDFAAKLGDMGRVEWGEVKVGGSNYITSYILPDIVVEFGRLYPKIEVDIIETGSRELSNMLDDEKLDLIIDSFDFRDVNREYFPLLKEKILLAVPVASNCNIGLENYRLTPDEIFDSKVDLAFIPKVSIEHFREEEFVLLKHGNSMYRHATSAFAGCGFVPKVSFRLDQLMTAYRLAAAGNGACFVSDSMFKSHRFTDDIFLYNVEGAGERMLYAAKNNSRHTSPAMEKFVEIAQSTVNGMGIRKSIDKA